MMFGNLAAQAGNFILGMCVLLGAAFVYQRSRRAAMYVALAGLGYALAVPLELFMTWVTWRGLGSMRNLFFTVVEVARHAVFYGGLALGMRTLAREAA